MTHRSEAVAAIQDLAQRLTPLGLPMVILVGLPKEAEVVRASLGLEHENNRKAFRLEMLELLAEMPGETATPTDPSMMLELAQFHEEMATKAREIAARAKMPPGNPLERQAARHAVFAAFARESFPKLIAP